MHKELKNKVYGFFLFNLESLMKRELDKFVWPLNDIYVRKKLNINRRYPNDLKNFMSSNVQIVQKMSFFRPSIAPQKG